jgi:hypothetical protein
MQEDVRPRVEGFIEKNTKVGRLEFVVWNGDHIADQIATGLQRENIFPKAMQTSFRKAVAMVDEPSVCVAHFGDLLRQLAETQPKAVVDYCLCLVPRRGKPRSGLFNKRHRHTANVASLSRAFRQIQARQNVGGGDAEDDPAQPYHHRFIRGETCRTLLRD